MPTQTLPKAQRRRLKARYKATEKDAATVARAEGLRDAENLKRAKMRENAPEMPGDAKEAV